MFFRKHTEHIVKACFITYGSTYLGTRIVECTDDLTNNYPGEDTLAILCLFANNDTEKAVICFSPGLCPMISGSEYQGI